MGLTNEERNIIVSLEMDKSDRFMKQADEMVTHEYRDLAANRYYYTCYHAVQALFIKNGLSCKTHRGMINMFNLHFVKTELVSMEIGSYFARMEQLREQADYNCNYDVTEREILEIAPNAKAIVATVKTLIAEDGK